MKYQLSYKKGFLMTIYVSGIRVKNGGTSLPQAIGLLVQIGQFSP